ncbi:MAG: MBL fold metallo-hydrolase [Woeseia sp.]
MTQPALALHILGAGQGASQVYAGQCSSAAVVTLDGKPACLIDIGFGVTRACLQQFAALPGNIIVTHNHSDHSAELPVVLRVEQAEGRTLSVFAEQEVSRRLQVHRLAEHAEVLPATRLANWHSPAANERIALTADLDIEFVSGSHSEHACGVLLYHAGKLVMGYTGDSLASEPLYGRIAAAPTRIYDARPAPSRWHATFDDLAGCLDERAWIVGHGYTRDNAPPDLPFLFGGECLLLD